MLQTNSNPQAIPEEERKNKLPLECLERPLRKITDDATAVGLVSCKCWLFAIGKNCLGCSSMPTPHVKTSGHAHFQIIV